MELRNATSDFRMKRPRLHISTVSLQTRLAILPDELNNVIVDLLRMRGTQEVLPTFYDLKLCIR
jgi:hypothetical protein